MNINNMHIAVQQGVDKINSLQADSLLSQEIDMELNKSIMRFVNLKYGKNNIYRKGFEESQKRIDDLRSLVSSSEEYVYFQERRILSNRKTFGKVDFLYVDKFTIPANYLYHINSYCNVLQNASCENDVRFELSTRTSERATFTFMLEDLKLYGRNGVLVGWRADVDILGGASVATDVTDVDPGNISSIFEIGNGATFSKSVWSVDYDNTGFLDNIGNTASDTNGYGNTPNEFIISGSLGAPTAEFTETVTVNGKVLNIVLDPNLEYQQYIITSILNTVAEGVSVYYEEYDGVVVPEKFTVELDLDVWGNILTAEAAGLIADTLLTEGNSVDLNTGAIIANTTGSQNAVDFTSYLTIQDTLNYSYDSVRTIVDLDTGDTIISETVGYYFDVPEWSYFYANSAMESTGLTDFNITSKLILQNDGSVDSTETAGLKRWLVGDNWSVDSSLYSAVGQLGEEFPGISKAITYVQHDDVLGLLKDPFNKPSDDRILGMFDNNSIFVYTLIKKVSMSSSDLVSVLPYSVKLKYLRKPATVSYSLNINCDLPQHTHEEIVAMTVSGILEGISDPRYKTHLNELGKNE